MEATGIHGYTSKLIITRIKKRIFLIDFQIGTGLYQKLFLQKYFFFYCALCLIRILRSGKNRRENNRWEWFMFVKKIFSAGAQKKGNFLFLSKWIPSFTADGLTIIFSTSRSMQPPRLPPRRQQELGDYPGSWQAAIRPCRHWWTWSGIGFKYEAERDDYERAMTIQRTLTGY